MSDLGREIPAGSPEYTWVSSIVASVEKRTGVNTRWNGRLYEEPNPDYLGSARHDGSMTVSVPKVLEPVRNAYYGKHLSPEELVKVRDAVLTVTHESAHLSSRLGDPSAPGATPLGDDADRALEEGLAESWTHNNVDAVIFDIGMDQHVPAVVGQPNIDAYRAYSAAANVSAHGLGTVARVHPEEIHRVLHTADRTQRWNAAADLIIDQRLDGLMPPEHRAVIRQGLTDRMRAEYAKLPAVQGDANLPGAQKSEAGRTIGQAMVQSVDKAVNDAASHYQTWSQQQAQQAAQQAQQQTSPVPQQPHYQQPAAQQPQFAQPPGQQAWSPGPQGPQFQQPQYQAPQSHQQPQPVPQAQNPQPWQLPQPGQQYQPPTQPAPQPQPQPEQQHQQPAQNPQYQQPIQQQSQQAWWQQPVPPTQQQQAGPPQYQQPQQPSQAQQQQGGQAGWWQWSPEQQRAGQGPAQAAEQGPGQAAGQGRQGDGEVGKLRQLVGGQRPAAEAVGGQRGGEASGEVPNNVRQLHEKRGQGQSRE